LHDYFNLITADKATIMERWAPTQWVWECPNPGHRTSRRRPKWIQSRPLDNNGHLKKLTKWFKNSRSEEKVEPIVRTKRAWYQLKD